MQKTAFSSFFMGLQQRGNLSWKVLYLWLDSETAPTCLWCI